MFKNLRGLKLTSKKKQQQQQDQPSSSSGKEIKKTKPPRPKTRPTLTALKKIRETMGNTISMLSGQHYVENVEEHATKIMAELDKMRHNRILCDVDILKCDGTMMSAHKIVVSFNEKLLEIASEQPDGHQNGSFVAEEEKSAEDDEKLDEVPELPENDSQASTEENKISCSESVNSAGDLVKQLNGDDVIKEEVPGSPQPVDIESNLLETNGDVKKEEEGDQNKEDSVVTKTDDVTQQDASNLKVDEKGQNSDENENSKSPEEVNGEENPAEDSLVAPAEEEIDHPAENGQEVHYASNDIISTDKTKLLEPSAQKPKESCDVTIEADEAICPASFEDPLEILINFFYTSHINITTKNVEKLRVVAQQCNMQDVTMACNEFENVLRAETENFNSNEEKEEAAKQFRYQYSDPQMALKLLEHFEKLRSHSRHTDVVVTSPTTSMRCPSHSALLAASSTFFSNILNPEDPDADVIKTDVTQTNDDVKEIEVPDVKDNILQGMVSYFYTAKVPVSSPTASGLMSAADVLGSRDVIEGCAEFLEGTMTVQQSIQIYNLADKHHCDKLKGLVTNFIQSNFLSVSRTNDFLSVTKEWISEILSSNNITTDFPACDSEYQIYDAVKKWVNKDLEARKPEVFEVMKNVRIPLIGDSHLINDISTDLLVMENDELCDRVSGIITGKSTCKFKEEVSMRGDEYVLMVGGSAPIVDETSDEQGYTAVAFSDYVTMYDVASGRMHELTYLPETRSLHCALAIDNYVIIAGGFDKYSCITNEVYCLDLSNVIWTTLPHMKVKRSCFVMFYLNDYIYAAGGLTPTGYSSKVERYNREKMKWEYVEQLPKTYYRHAGCVYHGELLITGGNEKSTDALKYSPSGGGWRMMKPMNQGRDSHAMTTASDKVYVIGGDNKTLTVEEYNSSSECWQLLPNIFLEPVYLSGVTTFNDKIYLIGGWKGDDDAHDDIKCFDPQIEKWSHISTRLRFPRGSLTATRVRTPTSYLGKTVPMTQKQQP